MRLPGEGTDATAIAALIATLDDATLTAAIRNLGGHDLAALTAAYRQIDDTRPTVIIAYTIKGHGLPTEGHPQNHSALLSNEEYQALAARLGTNAEHPWPRFDTATDEGRMCAATAARLRRDPAPVAEPPAIPTDIGRTPKGTATTQAALGRVLLDLTREAPEAAKRVVTVSPDVSSTTNLGGWVNKVGVWSATERRNWFADDAETIMHWRERPAGSIWSSASPKPTWSASSASLVRPGAVGGSRCFPIGVLYDPFVERALEPWSFGIYAGGQSIIIGTPSGVSLAAEGGAHQSIKTPSIGLEQPGCISYEPAFAIDVEWTLLASIARLGRPDGNSAYLRLSTRPVDQSLAGVPDDPAARERRRRQVVAGAYPLQRREGAQVTIATMGAMVSEALAAANRLEQAGIPADVICVTSPGLLFQAWQARQGRGPGDTWILDQIFPAERATPMVTVLDGHPHALAFLANINQVRMTALGVSRFGQAGALDDVYRYHGIDADSIVRAALDIVN